MSDLNHGGLDFSISLLLRSLWGLPAEIVMVSFISGAALGILGRTCLLGAGLSEALRAQALNANNTAESQSQP